MSVLTELELAGCSPLASHPPAPGNHFSVISHITDRRRMHGALGVGTPGAVSEIHDEAIPFNEASPGDGDVDVSGVEPEIIAEAMVNMISCLYALALCIAGAFCSLLEHDVSDDQAEVSTVLEVRLEAVVMAEGGAHGGDILGAESGIVAVSCSSCRPSLGPGEVVEEGVGVQDLLMDSDEKAGMEPMLHGQNEQPGAPIPAMLPFVSGKTAPWRSFPAMVHPGRNGSFPDGSSAL